VEATVEAISCRKAAVEAVVEVEKVRAIKRHLDEKVSPLARVGSLETVQAGFKQRGLKQEKRIFNQLARAG